MKLKRSLSLILCIIMLMSAMPVMAADTIHVVPINVMVGGKVFLPTDVNGKNVPVFAYNGTTYAPLRALAEAYGLEVGYNGEKNLATVGGTPSADGMASKGTAQALTKATNLNVTPINIEVNGSVFQPKDVNGKNVPVFAYNGTTYAPLRALAEAYGLSVGYDGAKNMATVDFVDLKGIDFEKILADVTAQRKAEFTAPPESDEFTSFLVDDPETKNLLTKEERNALLDTDERYVKTVTYEQAVSDVDLLFRALHVGYASYYYFGKDKFDKAEADTMAWLGGKTTVDVDELTDVLRKNLLFMVDRHSFVGYDIDKLEGIRYEYHYDISKQFDKDDKGYFKVVNGTRYDFVSFGDSRVTMEPTLLESGKIVYSPVLFCPNSQVKPSEITLKTANGTVNEKINWTESSEVEKASRDPNFYLIEENDIAYINIDCYDNDQKSKYSGYAPSGRQVKDCKAVIFDIRNNSGGTGNPTEDWVRNFTGIYPEQREMIAHRYGILNSTNSQSKYEVEHIGAGKWVPNDIPVIVLVGDACGSNGEMTLNMLKTMENVLVIGTNSNGCALGGNCVETNLPNTNINADIGTMINFAYEIENVDCIGYTPDVWCDANKALDAAMNMLINNDFMGKETAETINNTVAQKEKVKAEREEKELHPSGSGVSLKVGDLLVEGGVGFGASGTWNVTVLYKGKPLSDYEVFIKDTSIASVTKNNDGTFTLSVKNEGETEIFIQNDKFSESFGLKGKKK